jgi:hypothetical protein
LWECILTSLNILEELGVNHVTEFDALNVTQFAHNNVLDALLSRFSVLFWVCVGTRVLGILAAR